MSQPTNAASSSDAAPKRIFPRPFHAGPNPVAGAHHALEHKVAAEPVATGAAPASSPVRRLDISLRCVFGWLDLADLHRVLSVSKQWSANVSAMPPIGADLRSVDEFRPLLAVCASPLAQHVVSLGQKFRSVSASVAELALVTARMPALHTLNIGLVMPPFAVGPGLLVFPQRLTKLGMRLDWSDASDDTPHVQLLQRVIRCVGTLVALEDLTLIANLDDEDIRAEVSFEPLRALHRLHTLYFSWLAFDVEENDNEMEQQTLSTAQLDCVRSLTNERALVSLDLFSGSPDRLLEDMMTRNDTAPILVHEVHFYTIAAGHSPALRCFPALRTLNPDIGFEVVDFLPSMPQLHTLKLQMSEHSVSADQLVDAVQPLARLTSLYICEHPSLGEAHLTRMLASLTLLHTLSLSTLPLLRSLSFLASGAITRSLTSFSLTDCRHGDLRTSELLHLHACKRLTSVGLRLSFSDSLSEFARLLYTQRPCSVLPALEDFRFS